MGGRSCGSASGSQEPPASSLRGWLPRPAPPGPAVVKGGLLPLSCRHLLIGHHWGCPTREGEGVGGAEEVGPGASGRRTDRQTHRQTSQAKTDRLTDRPCSGQDQLSCPPWPAPSTLGAERRSQRFTPRYLHYRVCTPYIWSVCPLHNGVCAP